MACPVTCQRRSASTIMSGMAIPMTANTMWKARDTPICERAASKSGIGSKIATVRDGGGRWRLWRLVEVTHEPTSTILHQPPPSSTICGSFVTFLPTTDTRGDLRPIAATLNNSLKRQDDHHPPRPLDRRQSPRPRRGDGHHAVLEGLLPQRVLRRAERETAQARPGSARGLRARRGGDPRDQHLRRQPGEAPH